MVIKMSQDIFAVIGGDFRSVIVANQLAERGNRVKVCGFDDKEMFHAPVLYCNETQEALQESNYIIFPLPCSVVGEQNIHTPLYNGVIPFAELLPQISENSLVLGGMISDEIKSQLSAKGVSCADYFAREEFAVKNAIPTAEGAIEIALRETPFTLHGASCLVTGYGRIAKMLAQRLRCFGARVSVCARRVSDLAWIDAEGCNAVEMKRLQESIHTYDVIFNTVPHKILTDNLLLFVKQDCLIIDLASKPGGVDFDAAQKNGLNVIWALSLPGKCAPLTAGSIICDTIMNIIREREEDR